LEGVVTKDYPVTFRPQKGQRIIINVADLLVRLMVQTQVKEPERRSRPHYGKYLVKVFAKGAGSPTWSEEEDKKGITFVYFWIPKGFPEQDCEEFGNKFNQPLVFSVK
jgi:hypothetical protein